MRKKIYTYILIVLILLISTTACSNEEDKTFLSNKQNTTATAQENGSVVFGEKTGEKQLKARNVFKTNESAYFLITSPKKFDADNLIIIINKNEGQGWKKLTSSKLKVDPSWNQVMNGLPPAFLKQIGKGAYQLEAQANGEMIAKGEFVIEK